MKTLVILAQKGGSGKTTLAVHMAVCAARQKRRTALIDIDPQSSAFNWNESRDEGRKLDAAKAEARQIPALLQQAKAGGIDLAIIDTAPHSDSAAAIAAQYADLVLIPCRPARFDLDAIASTVQIATVAKKSATVVINAAPRGKLAEEARAALERQGITVIDTVLHQRAAYSHAVIDGRSVHEYEPDGKAAAEIDELYNHLTGLLGYKQARGKAA
ncbi:MAG: AAA family ATPase [Pseudomonadota bacterium]|jgi:chromosome partitioning protein|nr:AAA family ATPase [Pseudomonadota bacterium]